MKVSRTIAVSVLMVLFLAIGVRYGQGILVGYAVKGVEYAAQGEFKRAKEELEKALKVDPFLTPLKMSLKVIEDVIEQRIKRKVGIHLFKGTAYNIKGRRDKAIAEYNKAIEINPRYAPAYLIRGQAYRGKSQYDRAFSDLNKALKINPRLAAAYFNKALACEMTGRTREAIEAYRGFIKYAPPQLAPYIKHAGQRIKELGR
ncbi:MAG: tetratricopeptide repeat protein [Candidatus Hydrothermarchaeales archaeon]